MRISFVLFAIYDAIKFLYGRCKISAKLYNRIFLTNKEKAIKIKEKLNLRMAYLKVSNTDAREIYIKKLIYKLFKRN